MRPRRYPLHMGECLNRYDVEIELNSPACFFFAVGFRARDGLVRVATLARLTGRTMSGSSSEE